MFIERTDLIDRFANYFADDTSGNWYFHPGEDWPWLPVSESEMLDGIERYRRRSMAAMSIQWITFFAAFLWFCWVAYSDANAVGVENALAFAFAFLAAFVGHSWALRSSFRPFYRRALEYAADRQRSGGPIGSPNIIYRERAQQARRRQGTWWRGP